MEKYLWFQIIKRILSYIDYYQIYRYIDIILFRRISNSYDIYIYIYDI